MSARKRTPVSERLWRRVVKRDDGCWEWQGKRGGIGYGHIKDDGGATRMAHRVSWELVNGPVPDGMILCHTCDNPPCVNPDHLFLGTHAANAADRNRKGRDAHGERHPHALLNEALVIEIRRAVNSGERQADVARRLGFATSTISGVVKRHSWKHVA